ncbi:MAG: hypothetical protein IID44_21870 [Planctomycetes bacterium]|nr:hypothetical protein [Planctomycetota bacterium]
MKFFAAQSKEEGVSVLALVETAGSAAAALWLAIHWGTYAPFAISVVVAPFLLLRTHDSTAIGVKLARRSLERCAHRFVFIRLFLVAIGPIPIRVVAMIRSIYVNPRACISALPANWWNLTARTDSTVIPEPIPGYYRSWDAPGVATFWDFQDVKFALRWNMQHLPAEFRRRLGDEFENTTVYVNSWIVLIYVTWGFIAATAYLPALLYRWSLKSTFWIYLPLLWVVQPARYERKNVWVRLKFVRDDQVVLFMSAIVLALGLLKIRVWQMKTALSAWWNDAALGKFLGAYVAPDSMPLWQYISMVNSILALTMFFIARSAIQSKEEGTPWPESPLDNAFRWATACRRILTTYTTSVLVMTTVQQGFPGLPPLGAFWPQ